MKRLFRIGHDMYMLTPGMEGGDFCPEDGHWPLILVKNYYTRIYYTLRIADRDHGEYPTLEAARAALTLLYGSHSMMEEKL
jgi:hypothetical protein